MANKEPYQMFPRLSPQQYQMLEEDIKARGVMVPVEMDEDGHILDGHHRREIAEKHGLECPEVVRQFDTAEEKREHVIKLNLCRRQMTDVGWGRAFEKLCKTKGVTLGRGKHGRGGRGAKELKVNPTLNSLAKDCGVSEATAKRRMKAAREYETLPDMTRASIDCGKTTVSQVKKEMPEPKKPGPCKKLATSCATVERVRSTYVDAFKKAWRALNEKERDAVWDCLQEQPFRNS